MEFDPLYIITVISVSVAAVVGIFTIRNEIKKSREEYNKGITNQIVSSQNVIKHHIDEKLDRVDSKFKNIDVKLEKEEDDISDIESDMKQMTADFKAMCDKISKFDFVVDSVLPDFKVLQKDFYQFKTAVDTQLALKRNDLVIQRQDAEDDINK